MKGGDIDGNAVVDGEVFDEGGFDVVVVFVAQEYCTALFVGQLSG